MAQTIVSYDITLDLIPKINTVKVRASMYDNGTRLVNCTVTRDGETYDLTEVDHVRVEGTRTDDVGFISACTVSEDGIASFYITNEMTGCAGKHPAELVLYDDNDDRLGSMNFIIQVEAAPLDEDSAVAEEDATILQQYLDQVEYGLGQIDNAIDAANAAAQNAATSEQNAADSADDAEEAADRAEQAAATAGYMGFHIDDNGHLIYERTSNVEADFYLENGHLYLEATA